MKQKKHIDNNECLSMIKNNERNKMPRQVIKGDSPLDEARHVANIHRKVRQWFRSYVTPGMKLIDAVEALEEKAKQMINANGINAGLAFPLGCSINNCAAHFTPNKGDTIVIKNDDVIKFDLGLHVNGTIIDSAWTMCWNDMYDPLLQAVQESTNAGINAAGIDVRISDIGAAVQEVMESHEVMINGKVYPIKSVNNLCGHSIGRYKVHSGKIIPMIRNNDNTKLEENEFYAIETFGSTGTGIVHNEGVCSHYMRSSLKSSVTNSRETRDLLECIETNFSTLGFCRRYLDKLQKNRYLVPLRNLVNAGLINEYPPLCDIKNSYIAQFEHTIILRSSGTEVISRGDDY